MIPDRHYGLIESHQTGNDCNRKLTIAALDAPGKACASSVFQITGFDTSSHPINKPLHDQIVAIPPGESGTVEPETIFDADHDRCTLIFQNGNPNDPAIGSNGITNEALLAVLETRFAGFQRGPFACDENAAVLVHLNECLKILAARSLARIARGVEGQQVK